MQEQHGLSAPGLVVPEPRAVDVDLRTQGDAIVLARMDFEHVLVVGAGQMGGGIAQVVAASGRRVSLYDAAPGSDRTRPRDDAASSLEKLAEKGGADPDEVLRASSRSTTSCRPTC